MAELNELRPRWEQCLASYDAEKTDIESRIETIRAAMGAEQGPLPDAFLAKLKNRLARGAAVLKAHKQIHDLERRLSASQRRVKEEAGRVRDQLTEIALSLAENAGANAQLAHLRKSSKALAELRRNVAEVIEDLDKAASAQDFAYNVGDGASTWQAKDSADQADRSLNGLVGRLRNPPPGLERGSWSQIGLHDFNSLGLHTFVLNRSGGGRWLNTEMARTMRGIIGKLRALDNSIGAALRSIPDRRASLHGEALAVAGARDTDFSNLRESVERWL